MPQAPPTQRVKRSPEEVVEELRRLRAEMRAEHPEVTDAEWDELADRLGDEVKAALAERVRRSRGASD